MLRAADFFVLLLALGIGCSNSEPDPLCEMEVPPQSQPESTMSTTTMQTLYRRGSKICEITEDGEVWINGDKQGSIESNGEIWVAGNKEGSIETNGKVWKAGNKIGDVTTDSEVWYEGNKIGEIDSDGTVWHNGDSVGSTAEGDPKRAAIVFFFNFFRE